MHRPVAITADSTCDMTPEMIRDFNVGITPLFIVYDSLSFADGIDITPDEIFRRYNSEGVLPKTAAVTPADYHTFFKSYTDKGFDVVHVNISSKISSSHNNALLASAELDGVYPVDSESLCTGMAHLILKACNMRDENVPASEIAASIDAMKTKVNTTFIINKLDFLAKGGRCSSLTALGANLLGIRPSIDMAGGVLSVGKKYRGKLLACYEQYTMDRLANPDELDLDRVIISHSGVSQEIIEHIKELVTKQASFKEVYITRAGCTITAHCGPDTLAVITMNK